MAVCSRQEVEEAAGPGRGSYLQRIHSYQNGATGWGPSPENVRLWRAFRLWLQCLSLDMGESQQEVLLLGRKGILAGGSQGIPQSHPECSSSAQGKVSQGKCNNWGEFPQQSVAAGLCSLQCHSGLSTLHSKPHSRDLWGGGALPLG